MQNKDDAAPGLRERKKRATRAALADAAVRLAAEHGAENVTVEAISSAAGVSTRTFFNYFDSHDDAFLMIDAEVGKRIRRTVREAPAGLPVLDVLRQAFSAELMDVEERHEIWSLRAKVFQRSPHLLVRGLGAHMAEELELAETVAERLGRAEGEPLGLYPRLVAAVAATAIRVSVEEWCARTPDVAFAVVFRDAFDHLASGLHDPPPGARSGPPTGTDS
ncbi:TetR/AcrR family transcriptional regulator [Streptomyces candidus]|uniref:AcrR family transcriptional regulator n=1 Tax=Streptomyces candidus TaxID=67283 RepID=A0A7X0HPS0_9ACTN|nr:TetR family transcriptional regulator [Streptomyces candidus]MBB6440123.1 AcrR family transcriptional regulator [Streptomyces candidus]GHH49518.1 TetR family transcriptional regulator [Streptomyces candidus]